MTTIILGMHRSGTSVLGNILCELGWSVGLSPMPAGDDNPQGFFENVSIMRLHDEMLFSANSTWSDPHPFPSSWWTPEKLTFWAGRIQSTLEREFPDHPLRLIKDPRMCRLLPPWRKALGKEWRRAYFLLPVRHPLEVASSLKSREGMSLEYGVLLWLTHFFESEKHSRGTKRLFLLQDRLIQGEENQNLARFYGCEPAAVAAAQAKAVRPGLRHHIFKDSSIFPGTKLGGIAGRVWELVEALSTGDEVAALIDELRSEFDDHLGFVPREFFGTSSTGPRLPAHGIPSHLQTFDMTLGVRKEKPAFLKMEGDVFSVKFEGIMDIVGELSWKVELPGPCELAITRVAFADRKFTWQEANAFDQKGSLARFLEGDARYQITVHKGELGSEQTGAEDVLEIQGILRLLAPASVGEELTQINRELMGWEERMIMCPPVGQTELVVTGISEEAERVVLSSELRPVPQTGSFSVHFTVPEEMQKKGGMVQWHPSKGMKIAVSQLQAKGGDGRSFPLQFQGKAWAESDWVVLDGEADFIELHPGSASGAQEQEEEFNQLPRTLEISGNILLANQAFQKLLEVQDLQKKNDRLGKQFAEVANEHEELISGLRKDLTDHLDQWDDKWKTQEGLAVTLEEVRHQVEGGLRESREAAKNQEENSRRILELVSKGIESSLELKESEKLLKQWIAAETPRLEDRLKWWISQEIPLLEARLQQVITAGQRRETFPAKEIAEAVAGIAKAGEESRNSMLAVFKRQKDERRLQALQLMRRSERSNLWERELFAIKHGRDASVRDQKRRRLLAKNFLAKVAGRWPKLFRVSRPLRRAQRTLRSSGIFDEGSYLSQCGSAMKIKDPLLHYLVAGWKLDFEVSSLVGQEYLKQAVLRAKGGRSIPLVEYLENPSNFTLAPNALFDPRYYLEQYPDVAAAGMHPLVHFLKHGASQGCKPSALFDTAWYLATYPNVASAGRNPLEHYLSTGAREGYNPNALFNSAWYVDQYPEVGASGRNPLEHFINVGVRQGYRPNPLFDVEWYCSRYPEVQMAGLNPLHHYLASGAREGFQPNSLFDSGWYLEFYPQVARAGLNPLAHYLATGWREGCKPHALFDPGHYARQLVAEEREGVSPLQHFYAFGANDLLTPHPLFDPLWYGQAYPEVERAGINPFVHYVATGAAEGYHPHALFDSAYYRKKYADFLVGGRNPLVDYVSYAAQRNPCALFDTSYYLATYASRGPIGPLPLHHFIERGAAAGWNPSPLFDTQYYVAHYGALFVPGENPLVHYRRIGEQLGCKPHPLFDPKWYGTEYPDALAEGGSLLEHFIEKGASLGYKPHPLFDTLWYFSQYSHVKEAAVNPLIHYLATGAREGTRPNPLFDSGWYLAAYPEVAKQELNPLVHYLATGAVEGFKPNALFDSTWYSLENQEVGACDWNPLCHYLLEGEKKGCKPNPLFDPLWYTANHPGFSQTRNSPLAHYLDTGAKQGCHPHPLFDSGWYLGHYPEVAKMGINPLAHFLATGARQGFRPNPLFDSSWYISQYGVEAGSDFNPLVHFLDLGFRTNCNPNPLFDSAWYVAKYPDATHEEANPLLHYLNIGSKRGYKPHPLFDPEWYSLSCPEWESTGYTALAHFFIKGGLDGCQPHVLFDSRWYWEQYPEVKAAGYIPLVHYLGGGARQGFDPHPLFHTSWYWQRYQNVMEAGINPLVHYVCQEGQALTSPNPLFDTGHYSGQYDGNQDKTLTPLAHYLLYGEREGLTPHPLFDSAYYRQKYPEVPESGINPLVHYLATGATEGRNPSPLFEGAYYFELYPEIQHFGINPLLHYWEIGGREGRNPNHVFDGQAYLDANPDVAQAGLIPLHHYIASGENEGRLIPGKFDPVFYRKQLEGEWRGRSLLEHYLLIGEEKGLAPASIVVLCDLATPKYVVLPPVEKPMVSVVIPVFNQFPFTLNCLHCLSLVETEIPYEVIVVDDCSSDETASIELRAFNLRYVRNETNQGFGGTCNRGAAEAKGEFVLFLNNDTKVTPGWLDAFIEAARLPKVGYVGAKLIYPNGTMQEAGGLIWRDGSAWNYGNGQDPANPIFNYLRKADYCSAAAALVPRKLFLELGGFSPEYERAYYEDTDLCMRIREAGYDVIYQPAAEIYHYEGGTCGKDVNSGIKQYQVINREVFVNKWKHVLEGHPENADVPGHFKHLYPAGTVLFIDDLLPFPKISSGGLRAWNIILLLQELGHHVTFIPAYPCAEPKEQQEALQALGVQVLGPPDYPTAQQWLSDDKGNFALQEFDKVIVARHYIASELYPEIRRRMPNAAIIFDTVDLHYVRLRREAEISRDPETYQKAEIAYNEEIELLEKCDQTWVVSQAEKEELYRILPEANVQIVSNIVPVPGTKTGWESRSGILFIGGFNHTPNQDAVLWFIREVYPRVVEAIPDMVFHILGSNMPEEFFQLASDHIHPVGFVDDPEPWFEEVRLSVAPLRYGAGVKGKVNQSLSLGVPVVGTSVALEGMGIPSGSCAFMADDPEVMADSIIELYKNPELWEAFSAKGIELMHNLYSLEFASKAIKNAIQSIVMQNDNHQVR